MGQFCMITGKFISSADLADINLARAYLRMRAKNAVLCHSQNNFKSTIELAQHLARYW